MHDGGQSCVFSIHYSSNTHEYCHVGVFRRNHREVDELQSVGLEIVGLEEDRNQRRGSFLV